MGTPLDGSNVHFPGLSLGVLQLDEQGMGLEVRIERTYSYLLGRCSGQHEQFQPGTQSRNRTPLSWM